MSIPVISATLAAIKGLKRICPQCRQEQLVPRGKKQATVPCRFCGALIPPSGHPQK